MQLPTNIITPLAVTMVLMLSTVVTTGCITGRLHAGPTVDSHGNVGVRAGFTGGIVVSGTDRSSGMMITEGIGGGLHTVNGQQNSILHQSVGLEGFKIGEEGENAFYTGFRFEVMDAPDLDTASRGISLRMAMLRVLKTGSAGSSSSNKYDLFSIGSFDQWTNIGIEIEPGYFENLGAVGYMGVVVEFLRNN